VVAQTHKTFTLVQAAAEILTAMVIANPPGALAVAPLRFLGRISYGVYLWHIPLLWMLHPDSLAGIAVLVAASILAGWLSHVLVERWFLRRAIIADPGISPQPA
jgi:peptidoglycan/LPS O-acetylase OafA/YrhL